MTQVRLYARVSTELQRSGISIDTQLTRMKEYCHYKKYEIVKIYSDIAKTGRHEDREQLDLLMKEAKSGELIIVDELSRFSRNTHGALGMLHKLMNNNIYLISLSPDIDFSTSMGKAIYTILMAFYTMEREITAKKVSDNMKNLSKQKLLRSKPPFGWKFVGKNKDYERDEDQQKVIEKIVNLSKTENHSSICRILNDDGDNSVLKSKKDKKPVFYPATIERILKNYNKIEDHRIKTRHIKKEQLDESKSSSQNNG